MKEYIGNELELFKHAVNWKNYYAGFLKKFLVGDVLEVGAGIGETTHSLCDGSQTSWLCLEPDAALAAHIETKKKSGYLRNLIELKIDTIDAVQNRLFDAILYIDVIEHIEHDSEELAKAAERLKPGGHLIVLVPAHNFQFSEFDISIGHFRRYNKKMLAAAIPEPLEKTDLRYLDSVGLLASMGNKVFLKQHYPNLRQIKFWDSFMIPFSRIIDFCLFYSLGKTVIGIWENPGTAHE